MLTYKKVLEVFKDYLAEDESCEVLTTSQGHLVVDWSSRKSDSECLTVPFFRRCVSRAATRGCPQSAQTSFPVNRDSYSVARSLFSVRIKNGRSRTGGFFIWNIPATRRSA